MPVSVSFGALLSTALGAYENHRSLPRMSYGHDAPLEHGGFSQRSPTEVHIALWETWTVGITCPERGAGVAGLARLGLLVEAVCSDGLSIRSGRRAARAARR